MFRLSKNNIEFDRVARIVSGEDEGGYVKFSHDPAINSGYFIYECRSKGFDIAPIYDTWYETLPILINAVDESNWLLEWVN